MLGRQRHHQPAAVRHARLAADLRVGQRRRAGAAPRSGRARTRGWTSTAAIVSARPSKRLAAPDGDAQVRVALRAVESARQAAAAGLDRGAHVGYHLIGRRAAPARGRCRLRPRGSSGCQRGSAGGTTDCYLGAIAVLTALMLALARSLPLGDGAHPAARGRGAGARRAVQRAGDGSASTGVVTALVAPRAAAAAGIRTTACRTSARTMVIVPTLFTSVDGVRALIEQLEVAALGNLDPHVHFALLSDFADADAQDLPGDAAIIEAAVEGIEALNRRPGAERRPALLPVPSRTAVESCRRALDGVGAQARQDRGVQPAAARRDRYQLRRAGRRARSAAVGALLPHARHRHAAAARRRPHADRHDRASAQPAARRSRPRAGSSRATASCSRASASPCRAPPGRSSHASMPGIPASIRTQPPSPTCTRICSAKASSPARGSTTSTRSRPCSRTACPRTPCCRTISSKGLYARTALVSDVEVVDDYPSSVLAHARRQHRWVRGDWQILWWLFPFVPTRRGLARNRLPLISRWKILDNLRRSLVAPARMALLLLGWTVLPGIAVVLDRGWGLPPPIAPLVVRDASRRWPGCCAAGCRACSRARRLDDFRTDLARAACRWSSSPTPPCRMLHAIGLTLIRAGGHASDGCSNGKRRGQRGARDWSRRAYLRVAMSASPALALGTLLVVVGDRALGPAGRVRRSRDVGGGAAGGPAAEPPGRASAGRARHADRRSSRRVAHDTWRYFDPFVTAA